MATQNSINNTSDPLASTAVTVDPGASGDSYVQFDINGTGEFRVGVDDTDGDAFVISQGSALGTTNTFRMSANGERTMPLQPAFRAYSATLNNVTGDGTVYTLVFGTENFDQNNDFDGTSTFTAPVTGTYYFGTNLYIRQITTSFTSCIIEFNVNSGTLYSVLEMDPSSGMQTSGNDYVTNESMMLSLSATDTVTVQLTVAGSTKTVDIRGSDLTHFFGYLVV